MSSFANEVTVCVLDEIKFGWRNAERDGGVEDGVSAIDPI
jgi:hypothetical protein